MGWGRSTATCWLPSSDLACPGRVTYRGAGDAGTRRRTRRTIPASTGRGAASKLSAARVSRFTVERRRREQLPCAQPILGPAGARLGKRTATRHDGIGTSPRHRCSRRYWGIGRSGDLGRSVVSPVNGPVGVRLLSEDFGRMLSLSGDRSATQPGFGTKRSPVQILSARPQDA
jgi:hypothetical protein